MIRDIEVGGRRIWGKVIYNVSYDIQRDEYFCECKQFQFKGTCKHIQEFKKLVKQFYDNAEREESNAGNDSA